MCWIWETRKAVPSPCGALRSAASLSAPTESTASTPRNVGPLDRKSTTNSCPGAEVGLFWFSWVPSGAFRATPPTPNPRVSFPD